MSWNLPPQGITPAQASAGFQVHGEPVNPALLQRHNPLGDAIQEAIKTVVGVLDQQRRDKIANSLLAVDNAPKATAVDGTQPGTGTPSTALTSDEIKQNLTATYGGTQQGGFPTQDSGVVPDMGGVRAYLEKQAFDKQQQDDFDRNLKNQLTQSRIDKNNLPPRDPAMPEWQYKLLHPDEFPQKPDADTLAARKLHDKIYGDVATKAAAFNVTPEDFANDSEVKFVFQKSGQVASPSDLQNPDNIPFIMATGKLGNHYINAPYQDYVKLKNEAGSIPGKPAAAKSEQPSSALTQSDIELAMKARNDPAASPEHKAAAERILGAAGL